MIYAHVEYYNYYKCELYGLYLQSVFKYSTSSGSSNNKITIWEQRKHTLGKIFLYFYNINWLARGRCDIDINMISTFRIGGICIEVAIRWMPQTPSDGKSNLVQVMIFCRWATLIT